VSELPDEEPSPAREALRGEHAPPAWPARALAGLIAAATCAWLVSHVLAPAPIAPAAAALLSGALVAAVPRAGWIMLVTALSVAAALDHRPGGALAILLAALVPMLLLPRTGTAWPLPAVAPGLGALGLAGAWPALAAAAGSAWRRAALGAAGWIWLVLAVPVAGANLYLAGIPGTPPPHVWMGSIHETFHHVLWPLASAGAFTPALVWAAAAVVLPFVVRQRLIALDAIRVVIWAAMVVSATEVILAADRLASPGTAVLGAVASGLLALTPNLRSMESPLRS
jgi:hypothetical protein